MTKHPYEFGGILFTIAILGGILGGVAFDNYEGFPHGWKDVVDNGVHKMMIQKPSSAPAGDMFSKTKEGWADYYKNNMNAQLDCKKTSINLQEFYDCVNKP